MSCSNDVGFDPPSAKEVMVTAVEPVLVSDTICSSDVVPIIVVGKAIDAGLKVTVGVEGAVAVPCKLTSWGEPVALSAIESEPVREPAAAGLNSTETVQDAAAASEVPQVVADLTKEVALAPVMVSDVRVTAAVPVFLIVITCAAVVLPTVVEAKVRAAGDSDKVYVLAAAPVPERLALWVPALSTIFRVAVSVPVAVGLNDTVTVQEAPTASEEVVEQVEEPE